MILLLRKDDGRLLDKKIIRNCDMVLQETEDGNIVVVKSRLPFNEITSLQVAFHDYIERTKIK